MENKFVADHITMFNFSLLLLFVSCKMDGAAGVFCFSKGYLFIISKCLKLTNREHNISVTLN